MRFTIYGTPVETDDPVQIAEIFAMLRAEEESRKTPVDQAREAIEAAREVITGRQVATIRLDETEDEQRQEAAVALLEKEESNGEAMVFNLDDEVPPELPPPAKMPKHVDTPPIAYVTQAQSMVVELLRHYHPQGLSTKDIGEKLRWNSHKASRVTTYLHRNESGAEHRILAKVPGHRRFTLTEYGRRCAFKIVTNPSTYREHR